MKTSSPLKSRSGLGIAALLCAWTLLPSVQSQQIVYVRRNGGSDAFTGLSWAQAKRTVQAAINVSTGEVWVAKGTNGVGAVQPYIENITLNAGIALYGGFAGTETARDQRDPAANLTVLDGDNNRVVDMMSLFDNGATRSVIDGFTVVRGGNQGAAIRVRDSGQTVSNCRFLTNASPNSGGAIWVSGGSPLIASNTFIGNTAAVNGGAIYCDGSPTLLNNLFVGNVAQGYGGAFSIREGVAANNVVVSNRAGTDGGGIHTSIGDARLVNNTIVGNVAQSLIGGGVHVDVGGTPWLANNIVAFNSAGIGSVSSAPVLRNNCVFGNTNNNYAGVMAGMGDISADPLLTSPAGGNVHLLPASPCIDAGTFNSVNPAWRDLDGEPRALGMSVDIGADELTAAPLVNFPLPVGGAAGTMAQVLPPDPMVPGGQVAWTIRGQTNGMTNQIVSQGRIESVSGELHVIADSSPVGATGHLVEAFRDGMLVESALVPAVMPLFRLMEPMAMDPAITLEWHGPAPGRPFWSIEFAWPQPMGSGPLVLGAGSGLPIDGTDRVRVSPVPVTQLMAVDPPSTVEVTGMPALYLEERALLFRGDAETEGRPHRALGAAMVQAQNDRLLVSNIGSSGQDGVSIDVGDPGTGIIVLTEPILLSSGLDLTLSALGTLNGTPDSSLGMGRVSVNGSPVLRADFSGAGSPNVTAEIFDGSMRVGSATFAANDPLTMSAPPMGSVPSLEAVGVVPPCLLPAYDGFEQTALEPLPCYFFGFTGQATFTAPGGQQFVGNRVRFLTASGQSRIQSLARFEIRGAVPAGMLTIAREKIRLAAPEVTVFFPTSGKPGDLITIHGRGFGNDADDLAVVSAAGNASGPWQVPFRVLSATDTRLTARVGQFAPGAQPGPLLVMRGAGHTGRVPLRNDDVGFGQPPQTGQGGGSPGGSGVPFSPESFSSGPCLVASTPVSGRLEVYFTGTWPADAIAVGVQIHARNQTTGHWLHMEAPHILLPPGCATPQCADAIADALQALAGSLATFTAEPAAFGQTRLKMEIPGGVVDQGLMSVCRNVEPDDPVVFYDIYNQPASANEIPPLEVTGLNFGFDPDALSVSAIDGVGGRLLPLRAKSASDSHITACVGALPPGAQLGALQIALGDGVRTKCAPSFPDVRLLQDVWVWHGVDPAAAGPNLPQPPVPPPPGPTWLHSPAPANGVLHVTIGDSWPSNALLSVALRAEDLMTGAGSFEMDAPTLQLTGGGTSLECAERLADVIRGAFRQQAGLDMGVRVDPEPGGGRGYRLTLFIPGGSIDRGFLTVCLAAPGPALVITDVQPRTGRAGDRVTITGSGFGTDPDDLLVFVNRSNAPTLLRIISMTDTMIVAQLGVVRPDAGPGPIVVARGIGERNGEALPGASLFNRTLKWNGTGTSSSSADLFTPIHRAGICFHSPSPSCDPGDVCVTLTGDWPAYSRVTVEAFFSTNLLHPGSEPLVDTFTQEIITPGGPSYLSQNAYLISALINSVFFDPVSPVSVSCAVEDAGMGALRLTCRGPLAYDENGVFTYETVPIYGFINVCVEPPLASGLQHLAFGQTRLTLNPTGGVDAIDFGTSGADGVRILLGEAQGWNGEFEPFSPAAGQQFVTTLLGARGGMANQPLATVRVEMENNQMMLSADWSHVGSRQLMLEVRNAHGVTLTNQMLGNNVKIPVDQFFPGLCANYSVKTYSYDLRADQAWMRFCKSGCVCDGGTNCWTEVVACLRPSDVPALSNLLASAVEFRSVRGYAPPSPPPPPALDTLHFLYQSVYVFGHVHRSRGEILMDAGMNRLTLSQFGAGAFNGVTIDLAHLWPFLGNPYVQGYQTELLPLALGDGTEFRVGAVGQFRSGPTTTNKFLGLASVRKPGASVELAADFSPIGATQVQVEVHRAETRIGGATLPAGGVLATLAANGAGMPRLVGAGKLPTTPFCFALAFDVPGTFTLSGGAQLEGDEIRLLAANATGIVEWLSTLELFAGGFDEVVIIDEAVLEIALGIERSGGGVRVFWPLPGTGRILEETPAFSPAAWMPVPFPYQTNTADISITVPTPAGNKFYRLRKP